MKRLLYLCALGGLVLAACGGRTPAPTEPPTIPPATAGPTTAPTDTPQPTLTPITVTDGRGVEITLDEPAQRIVSLAPSNTEIVFAIGAGETLVGRDELSDYPPEAQSVTSIGQTYGELNTEAIVSLEPDLVLAASITDSTHIEALEDLGLTVFMVANPQEFEGLYENLRTVGTLTGHEEGAEALVENLQDRVAAVRTVVDGADPVSFFYEIDASDVNAPWTTGTGTFTHRILTTAGGENIAADLESWAQISLEEIIVRDPEVIIFGSGPFVPTTVDSLKERPGWGQLTAVQEDRVYEINTDLLDLPGPRLVDGLERAAEILLPERFDE